MPSFSGGPGFRAPFTRNVWLRSTQDVKTRSFTCAANPITAQTIDGYAGQKVLQPGTVLASITSGPDSGKVGPYQPSSNAGAGGSQTLTETGAPTGGTFTINLAGDITAPVAYNASAAQVQAALEALANVTPGGVDLVVTGGPLNTTAITVTFQPTGRYGQGADPTLALQANNLTGGTTPTVTFAVVNPGGGTAGATDGRQSAANIVGINNTFLPWTLMVRDVEVAVAYDAVAVQAWCLMYGPTGLLTPIDNATASAMYNKKSLSILFV